MIRDATLDVGRLLDGGPCSRYQQWLVALTALAITFDGIDNQLLGIAIPSITADWGVTRAAFSSVVALNSLGMLIGGAAAGFVGDRAGRKVALAGSLALFGAVTVAVALADGVRSLALLRFLTGLGLGGAIPNAATLAAEYVPIRQRPLAVTLTIVCIPLGGTLAGLIAIPLLPALGWRTLFAVGGAVPVAVAVLFARLLPESPRYLSRHPARRPELVRVLRRMGHAVDADAVFAGASTPATARPSLATLVERGVRTDTLALWAAFFSCLLAVYLGFSWLPSILAAAGFGAMRKARIAPQPGLQSLTPAAHLRRCRRNRTDDAFEIGMRSRIAVDRNMLRDVELQPLEVAEQHDGVVAHRIRQLPGRQHVVGAEVDFVIGGAGGDFEAAWGGERGGDQGARRRCADSFHRRRCRSGNGIRRPGRREREESRRHRLCGVGAQRFRHVG
jgi:MFS family permease